MVLDFWSQLGIIQEDGIRILKDMGFPANSRLHSLNVQVINSYIYATLTYFNLYTTFLKDLTKALEDEADNSKDTLPLVVQTALITYKTEAQYLRLVLNETQHNRQTNYKKNIIFI